MSSEWGVSSEWVGVTSEEVVVSSGCVEGCHADVKTRVGVV